MRQVSRIDGGGPARGLAAAFVLALLFVLPVACGEETKAGQAAAEPDAAAPVDAAPAGRPNVILILADDLDRAAFHRSTLDSAWAPEGTSFTNALATTSLCCPSRASIFRGQYSHNTGLINNGNEEPGGGARFFRESGLEDETLATILQDDDYETWFGGKYLNGYEDDGGWLGYVPPGWDHWQAYLSPEMAFQDGVVNDIEGHRTDWLSGRAAEFIRDQRGSSKPFFMHISPWDTHTPLVAPERHKDAYPRARAPRPPSFDEADVSDKPAWIREKDPLKERAMARFDRHHGARLRGALTLEDLSRDIVAALSRAGRLNDTYLIFTSDNGYHMGLHRIKGEKWTPYTEAHEIPFVVRGPGVSENRTFDGLVANTDIAPTVLDLAGISPPYWMDGRSFVPFLDGTAPADWRSSLLIEGANHQRQERPAYSGVRRENDVYVRYATGEEEYYDLARDPYQLQNRPEAAPPEIKQDLEALENCAGRTCAEAENP